jgi:hypothetical protein
MATQTGPRLTITASCEGCCHVVDDRGVPLCALMGPPRGPIDRITFSLRTDWCTPDWCPELSAARLALARGIVAEAGFTLATACKRCGFLRANIAKPSGTEPKLGECIECGGFAGIPWVQT